METNSTQGRKRVLALSSSGGHWVQLCRILPAFDGCELTVATTNEAYRSELDGVRFHAVTDCNRHKWLDLARSTFEIGFLVMRLRPSVVVSTGAAPGYLAIRFGKLFGARTIWIDSIANAEQLSMSGEKAGKHADLWLTQWPHLAHEGGPLYQGNVL